MDVNIINPFITSAINVIQTMAFTPVTPGKPKVKEDNSTFGAVTGLIGLAGENCAGNMVISFDEKAILAIVGKMLGEEIPGINKDVVDAVGELTNMISGGAKSELAEMGYVIRMSIPVMIVGRELELSQLTKRPVLAIPMSIAEGAFVIEAQLSKLG